jgi:hypothetical protein
MANAGRRHLLHLLGLPGEQMLAGPLNLLSDAGPGGLRKLCVNEAELCGELWSRASCEAQHLPRLCAQLDELRPQHRPWSKIEATGAPQDITLASMKVEHLFPADEATRWALAQAKPLLSDRQAARPCN